MKLVYIAGPYSATPGRTIAFNINEAWHVAFQLAQAGVGFICPHTNCGMMDLAADPWFFYRLGEELLDRCDAVLMLDGWEESKGAVAEKALAEDFDMPVFYTIEEVAAWAHPSTVQPQ